MRTDWPFVGRIDELCELTRAVRMPDCRGVLISGAAGVGKTSLARRLFANLARGRASPFDVVATRASSTIPLAALSTAVRYGSPPEDERLLTAWAVDGLRAGAAAFARPGTRPPPLLVDDAHLLDPVSARVVHYLVRTGVFVLVATVRSGEPVPDEVTALWKDSHVHRLDLRPLGLADVRRILRSVLPDQAGPTGAARLWKRAAPNLLYLRELAAADGPLSPSLTALLEQRIGAVTRPEHDALELLSLGEPLELSVLERLVDPEAIDRLQERDLISIAQRHVNTARLAHPLYTDLVRARCPAGRRRRHWRRLADALERDAPVGREGQLRLATWRLNSGTAADGAALFQAAQTAYSMWDLKLAGRLADRAGELCDGLAPALLQAGIHTFDGEPERALAILRSVADRCSGDGDRTLWTATWAFVRFWADDDVDTVAETVDTVAAELGDAGARNDLLAFAATLRVHEGRYRDALAGAGSVLDERPLAAGAAALCRSVQTYGFAAVGRPHRALEACRSAKVDQAPALFTLPQITLALDLGQCLALLLAGRVSVADGFAAEQLRLLLAVPQADRLTIGYFAAVRAICARLAGRLDDARDRAREASDLLQGVMGCPALGAGEVAHVAALAGDADTATAWMARADRTVRGGMRPLQHWLELARAWVAAAADGTAAAVETAGRTLDHFRAAGLAGYEVFAAYDLVRLGAAAEVADRLAELAGTVEGDLAELCSLHATAAVRDDPALLRTVADRFAGLGLTLFAGEAGAMAAAAYERHGAKPAARRAAREARTRLPGYQRIRTPSVLDLWFPALTARERDVAALVADGLTNRAIAERLHLSQRTVENHLGRIFPKLRVADRAELAEAYVPEPPTAG